MTQETQPSDLDQALEVVQRQKQEICRLQRIIDSRPAINAGLAEAYIAWSQSIYIMDASHCSEVLQ